MTNKIKLTLVLIIILSGQSFGYAAPKIVVTITPIASLLSMLTKGKADIIVLDKAGGCPHHHNAKPSDKLAIDNSDMVIYIDENFDSLISPLLFNYQGKRVKISEFDSIDFKGTEGRINWHFWLDLKNAKELQKELAAVIIKTFPELKYDVQENLKEALIKIEELDKLKKHKLLDLPSVALLSDSLEYFFRSLQNSQLHIFQTSNTSLKNVQKLNNTLSSDSIKCIILDIDQNAELYKKYNKIIIQLDSENWNLNNNMDSIQTIFIDKYYNMINQLKVCR